MKKAPLKLQKGSHLTLVGQFLEQTLIKVWMAADASNGYVVNFSVYLGSEGKNRRIHGLGYDVVMKMARPFLNGNHHLFFDNYFSSPILLDHLLDQQTYSRSTVRCTRKTCRHALKTNFASLEKQSFGKEKASFLQNGTIKGI